MKQIQIGQQGKNTKAGEKKNQGKADNNLRNVISNEDEPREEPIRPTPRREYEDPGHEHVYQPPTNPQSNA